MFQNIRFTPPSKSSLFYLLFLGLMMHLPLAGFGQQKDALDWLINTSGLTGKHALGEHPRGLITASEVPDLRQRVQQEPFRAIFQKLQKQTEILQNAVSTAGTFQEYAAPNLAVHQSFLYLLSGEEEWAQKAYENLAAIFRESTIFNNPVSRGLTRANMLQKIALAYDFCYNAWSQEQRDEVNRQLYKLTYTVQANMGFDANYSLVSNWMGVRWGSSMLAALVWDNPTPDEPSLASPLLWDASNRLRDHLEEIMLGNGWNAESLGYHGYNWSFIGPALIAFQNHQNNSAPAALELFAPQANNTMQAIATAAVSVETIQGQYGMKPDLSDDHLSLWGDLFSMNFRLYPPDQIPALKWMHDYLGEESFYSILYYPNDVEAVNPEHLGWLSYSDPEQGVALFRNRFQDENDIVATFNTSATRVDGHWGPDVNTFRITGLGAPLVVGAGRTSLMAGQTNLFPGPVSPKEKGNRSAGEFSSFEAYAEGNGYACGKGSSTGVVDHKRCFIVDYSSKSGAEAVFVIADSSKNGRIWRLNTPEFNTIETDKNGFTITTPEGASLRGHVLNVKRPLRIKTGQVKYGGETVNHNTGINYRGENYKYNNWVDIENEGTIAVVLTIQPKGRKHPKVSAGATDHEILIGGQSLVLKKEKGINSF